MLKQLHLFDEFGISGRPGGKVEVFSEPHKFRFEERYDTFHAKLLESSRNKLNKVPRTGGSGTLALK